MQPTYPGCIEIPINCGPYPDSVCQVTQTAVIARRTATVAAIYTQTAQAGGLQPASPTATPTATATITPNASTATPTPNITPSPTVTLMRTPQPTAVPRPTFTQTTLPTAFPTPTVSSLLRCAPNDRLELSGTTRPQIALLVLFDDRPVGGGFSDRSGAFRLELRIGEEHVGTHKIVVREREHETIVATYTCETPPPPTPTPTFRPIQVTPSP
ncbi:hypothetical protein [Chloroflexus sp.]|uniref:hypothetical protein n=1 Tax=Chloroflexus sp. TaxID=1904827 RepID=UPI003C717707